LPGTLPYTAPEVLQLRMTRKEQVARMIQESKKALLHGPAEQQREVQAIFDRHRLDKDHPEKLGDLDVLAKLEVVGHDDVTTLVSQMRDFLDTLSSASNWRANDIYSSAICIWQIFKPGKQPFPEQAIGRQGAQEKDFCRAVQKGVRPDISTLGVHKELSEMWTFFTRPKDDCNKGLLEMAWQEDPAQRPSADVLLQMYSGFFAELPPLDLTRNALPKSRGKAPMFSRQAR
jgi:hypothetical protein